MNTYRLPTLNAFRVILALLTGFLLGGCGEAPRGTPTAGATPKVVSAEKTSFTEVTAHLDPGGSVYGYLGTRQWLEGLSAKLAPWRDLVLGIPEIPESERANVRLIFDVVARLVRESGLESLTGVGFSGIAVEPGFYRTRFFLHHSPGAGQGYLWTLLGKQPHALDLLDWLPEQTAWAIYSDFDVAAAYQALRGQVDQAGVAEVKAGLDQFEQMATQVSGQSLSELLGSLGSQFGAAITLDAATKIPVPMPSGQSLELPEPGLILAIKVRDEKWFDWADRAMSQNPQVIRKDANGLKQRTLEVPVPLPIAVHPTIARVGDYLFLASHERWIDAMLQAKAGKGRLQDTAEFKKLAKDLPKAGNQFVFASERLDTLVQVFQQAALAAAAQEKDGPPKALLQQIFALSGRLASLSISENTAEGWNTVSHGYQEPANAVVLPAVVLPTAIVAGMALPALAKSKEKAQSISCVNNLKQLGLAVRIYATDHEDQFPPDVRSLKDELSNVRILFCPGSGAAIPNPSWETLDLDTISYEFLLPGAKENTVSPSQTMFRCKFHRHVCLADGSVQQRR